MRIAIGFLDLVLQSTCIRCTMAIPWSSPFGRGPPRTPASGASPTAPPPPPSPPAGPPGPGHGVTDGDSAETSLASLSALFFSLAFFLCSQLGGGSCHISLVHGEESQTEVSVIAAGRFYHYNARIPIPDKYRYNKTKSFDRQKALCDGFGVP